MANKQKKNPIVLFIHKTGSPEYFYQLSGRFLPWLIAITTILTAWGLYQALYVVPPDYQQSESYRILFIHVPSAWMSMFIYAAMAVMAFIALVWRIKVAEICAMASAPIGAAFTFITLCTGALWGKPMWGAYWVWDARMTSELVLLFIYLGIIALYRSIDDRRAAARVASIMALVGLVNLPIIHYSVEWWTTLHQGQTIRLTGPSSIDASMLPPLIIMAVATKTYFIAAMLANARNMLIEQDRNKSWVRRLIGDAP